MVLALMLAGAACSAATRAASVAPAPPSDAIPCRPAELRGIFRGFQGGGGALAGAVVVANVGADPCWLDGSPRSVSLLDGAGGAVTVKEHAVDLPPNGGTVKLTPGAPLPAFGSPLAPGSAWFTLSWSNWCSDASPTVQALLIVLPAGGSITAPIDSGIPSWAAGPATPGCSDSHAGSTLTFGRFQPPAGE
ncbi:MAG TPA: DUF4232 domain-containing protein [Candidatus Dormibacteraeota bacterium]|nr:DUF4232 domain-containing protein [Candidatus Dormibacteraeota bacterium]